MQLLLVISKLQPRHEKTATLSTGAPTSNELSKFNVPFFPELQCSRQHVVITTNVRSAMFGVSFVELNKVNISEMEVELRQT